MAHPALPGTVAKATLQSMLAVHPWAVAMELPKKMNARQA
jgi:hypothetical protein